MSYDPDDPVLKERVRRQYAKGQRDIRARKQFMDQSAMKFANELCKEKFSEQSKRQKNG